MRPKILIVDDEEAMVFSLSEYLSQYADCLGATSYDEALDVLKRDRDVSLVISDIRMPGKDGFDLLMWLKEHRPKVKMIMITAYGSPSLRELARRRGAVTYLEKPLDLEQLLRIVRQVMEKKGFSMALEEMELPDLLQFLSYLGHPFQVLVRSSFGEEGEILVQGDGVVRVKTATKEGEEAFYEILNWEGGKFEVHRLEPHQVGGEPLGIPLSFLLLEGMKRRDEERARQREKGAVEVARSRVDELIERFMKEIPEFVSTEIVEIATGLSIGSRSAQSDFDSATASAAYAEVVKANEKGLRALGGTETVGTTEEIMVTTDKVYILITVLGDTGYYHGLAITRKGNLGLSRVIMRKYAPLFIEAIHEVTGA